MRRASLLVTLVMGALTLLLWALINRPGVEPAWPEKIQGFSFSPMRADQSPEEGHFPEISHIDEDMALVAGDAHAIRTYTVQSTLAEIPRLAEAHSLNVALGAWIFDDKAANEREINTLIKLFQENHPSIVRVFVGNEVLLRGEQTVEEMIDYLRRVRKAVWAPVSTAEPWHVWLEHPELVAEVDFIAVHILPYWEGIPVDVAVDYVRERYTQLQQTYPGKPIVISEVGWPSKGRKRQGAVASPANQAKFLRRFLAMAEREGYVYYIIEAFDQVWKRDTEGMAGSHWGVYDVNREAKFAFTEPVVRVPGWQGLAAVSIGLSILLLALLFRDSIDLKSTGRGFLAVVTYGIATFAVWMVYDYSSDYMTWGSLIVGGALFIAALGLILVLLTEAHEWAEALWMAKWDRVPHLAALPRDRQPMVSIHVPAYNEPPDMLIQTLDALAALDYPHYEVLVIDNNTKDPEVWRPVEAHCRKLGARFRFFHVDPLDGFKAGALNFALEHTDPAAEVVAVIDSDYLVDAGWLREMAPLFDDPDLAIAQAPQDYRDGAENAFKAMCHAEYRGFFNIGMVTRNERNAIIQHGTMTMVRRRTLDAIGGWAQWCITEDAELGLRIFEEGFTATYVPQSFGKGLMPDTFIDFKKQRFRWAYGAVLILRRHLMQLLGLEPTRLTRGQRYHFLAGWLPWLTDGFNLFFNMAALGWSIAMIYLAEQIPPPAVLFTVLPLTLFVFKMLKLTFLYRLRVTATWRQTFAAALAGLALSHTIARAVMSGFVTKSIGFFRTPKRVRVSALLRALGDAREELLFVIALGLAAWGVLMRFDGDMTDNRMWALVLVVQAIPYAAAVLMALISAMPRLPARLVGVMGPLDDAASHAAAGGRAEPAASARMSEPGRN